ncbi:MAG: hypothetical protein LDL22_09080, partial [Hyphomicrobiales bacterium]|nr:hypothetical protein [Hyphomicrobiales bacterium]
MRKDRSFTIIMPFRSGGALVSGVFRSMRSRVLCRSRAVFRFFPRCASVALALLGVLAAGRMAGAMEFATIPVGARCDATACPRALIAEGEITADAPARFARFLRQELQTPGLHAAVFLNSPGGNVE